jgi:hypothetical protein
VGVDFKYELIVNKSTWLLALCYCYSSKASGLFSWEVLEYKAPVFDWRTSILQSGSETMFTEQKMVLPKDSGGGAVSRESDIDCGYTARFMRF